ncbi:MAG: hypothetical protein H0T42_03170 [Deltaproteobacteria bacterium]|nr:hypothetical protein [Deltaproteobacteria bacterium]
MLSLMALACGGKEREDGDLCPGAVANARRFVQEDDGARTRYGTEPLTLASCRELNASRTELSCIAYASSWRELEVCRPGALSSDVARRY